MPSSGCLKAPTGIRQKVYLPVHRELLYDGSLYVKHLTGPNTIEVSIRRRNHSDQILASAKVKAASPEWQKYPFQAESSKAKSSPASLSISSSR